MTVYKSKIGLELVLPLALVLGGEALLMAYKGIWMGFILILFTAAFISYIFLTISYTITESMLKIKCGFIFNDAIDIKTIKEIAETHNVLSSPAASLGRLRITYGKFGSIMISPKERLAFIEQVTKINLGIEVKLRPTSK